MTHHLYSLDFSDLLAGKLGWSVSNQENLFLIIFQPQKIIKCPKHLMKYIYSP